MSMNKIVIVCLCLVLVVMFSGCINEDSNRVPQNHLSNIVTQISFMAPLNYTEVSLLNVSIIKSNINQSSYVVSSSISEDSETYVVNYNLESTNNTRVVVGGYLNYLIVDETVKLSNNKSTYIWSQYYPIENFSSSDKAKIDYYKGIIKNETIKIATTLNLTVDWNKVTWSNRT